MRLSSTYHSFESLLKAAYSQIAAAPRGLGMATPEPKWHHQYAKGRECLHMGASLSGLLISSDCTRTRTPVLTKT